MKYATIIAIVASGCVVNANERLPLMDVSSVANLALFCLNAAIDEAT